MYLEGFTDVSDALRPGVYALVSKGVVIYIGKSKRMSTRIEAHRRVYADKRKGGASSWLADNLGIPGVIFDEVHVCPCRLDQLDELERRMIDIYQPRYNVKLRTAGALPKLMRINGRVVSLAPQVSPEFERRF